MIVPALNIGAMTVVCFVIFLFLGLVWGRSDSKNLLLKMLFIVMTIWTGMNAVSIIWFNGV